MWKVLALVTAFAALASCTLDELQTTAELGSVDAESEVVALDEYVLAAPDCLTEDDCEYYPEQTLAQCLAACQAGSAAIEAFCRVVVHPAAKAACWGVVYAGPVACSGFCYWYFTP
jgi:hypothetical protein